ncbi:MAG: adenine phosphoribosyltransferase [Nitrososphaerota archaeon]|jgi:adenine phosphoribosyltransferase|nr:adenine phosphoribosyltransferase [Nitrososphaerota archaeon]MDG6941545.1 adenine phosphoribosyltransferase [Nitrososphaerota archaeon]MDG6951086.1 adenine phosphoribosyltransferase [Nitrososphaerota archaeon]
MGKLEKDIKRAIRNIPDYPKKGVAFKDLTTLWEDGSLTKRVTDAMESKWAGAKLDKIVGIEARGFIVGAPLADRLGIGFVPARKVGKLPAKKVSVNYELEYGRQGLEMHADSIAKGERVLIVDDLLATGGTSKAAAALVKKLGGKVVGLAFVTELASLKGREKLSGYEVFTLSKYD